MAHSLSTIQNCYNAKMLRPFMFMFDNLIKGRFYLTLPKKKNRHGCPEAWTAKAEFSKLCDIMAILQEYPV